jgi:hypothetical protein
MIESLRLDRATPRGEFRDFSLRVRAFSRSAMCRLMGGHWRVLHTTRNRMALRCVACGQESPGWQVGRGRAE